jgi:hypothetical protein
MLVSLAGTSRRRGNAVLAMADRQVLTRIRRLLNQEERSMKLSLREGFGLLGTVIVGGLLALGSQAAQPERASDSPEIIRQAMRKAAVAVKDAPKERSPDNSTVMTRSD